MGGYSLIPALSDSQDSLWIAPYLSDSLIR
jgi:hypothetical protein